MASGVWRPQGRLVTGRSASWRVERQQRPVETGFGRGSGMALGWKDPSPGSPYPTLSKGMNGSHTFCQARQPSLEVSISFGSLNAPLSLPQPLVAKFGKRPRGILVHNRTRRHDNPCRLFPERLLPVPRRYFPPDDRYSNLSTFTTPLRTPTRILLNETTHT